MQQNYFSDKNILYLVVDDDQYLNFVYDELKKRLSIYRFNAFEYSYKNGIRNTEKYIENLISEKKIDILLTSPFATEYQLSVEFYAFLKNKTKIVFWMFDDCQYFDSYSKYYCQIADCVITWGYFSSIAYRNLDVPVILSFPCHSKETYHPVLIDKDIDVSFLGDCNKRDRKEYINFLINNGVNIETFGRGSKNGFVELNRISEIFSRSKINLNFTKIDKLSWINKDNPLLERVRDPKGRPAEIAFTKSFCLSEYTPYLEVFFEIGKEIDIFYNKEELLEKVNHYLENEEEREKIAQNAYKKAIENYEPGICFPKLLKELEEILEKDKRQSNEIFLSKAFKIKSINGLTFSMFVLIKRKKIKYALELFKELFKYGIFIFFAGFYGGILRAIETRFRK